MTAPLLCVEDMRAGYGSGEVLFGVSLEVGLGEVATLLGRNGMGKTTTLRAIMGLTPPSAGSVRLDGARVDGAPPHRIAQAGVGYAPEGRQVFPTLTVEENLVAAARPRASRNGPSPRWTLQTVLALFPRLAERRRNLASQLSGGEQQMLAIGRALATNPRLLILDEATEGLAPIIRDEIWACLAQLKSEGEAILLVDKHLAALEALADRHTVLEKGQVSWSGDRARFAAERERIRGLIGV